MTRTPLSSAFLHTSSKATCTGVTPIFVRFIDICANPYSGIYHPMALTAFSDPGIITGSPSASFTTLPVTGSPSLLSRPRSLTSKAMAFALRTEVVLRFTLNATRKSRAPTMTAPAPASNRAGPKSGFHAGSSSLLLQPFIFTCPDTGKVSSLLLKCSLLIAVYRKLRAPSLSSLPACGHRHRLLHGDAGYRHKRADIGGTHARVCSGVL